MRVEDQVKEILTERFGEIQKLLVNILPDTVAEEFALKQWEDLVSRIPTCSREWVPDPGNPGGCDPFGRWVWPPDFRWETDDEFKKRILGETCLPD